MQIESLEEIIRLVLAGNTLFLTRSRSGCNVVMVEVVAEGRGQQRGRSGSGERRFGGEECRVWGSGGVQGGFRGISEREGRGSEGGGGGVQRGEEEVGSGEEGGSVVRGFRRGGRREGSRVWGFGGAMDFGPVLDNPTPPHPNRKTRFNGSHF